MQGGAGHTYLPRFRLSCFRHLWYKGVDSMFGSGVQFCSHVMRRLLAASTFQRLADIVMVLAGMVIAGQFFDEDGVSVLNLTIPVLALGMLVSMLNATGACYRYSYEMGREDKAEAQRQFGQAVIFAVASGAVLALLAYFGRDAYYGFMGASERLHPLFCEYWRYLVLLLAVDPLLSLLTSMVYNDGDARVCSVAVGVQLAGNIIFPCCLGSVMGIGGISLGLACSSALACAVCLVHFLRGCNSMRFRWHFKWRDFIYNAKYSLDDAFPLFYSGLFALVLTKYVIGLDGAGEAYLPVLTVVISLVDACVITDAIGQAVQPLVSVCRGEENRIGIRKAMRLATKWAVMEGVFLSALLYFGAEWLPDVFNIDAPVQEAEVKFAASLLTPIPLAYSLLYLYASYYLMIERVKLSVGILLVRDLAASLILPLWCGEMFGLRGVWLGVALAPVVTLVLTAGYVLWRHGRRKFPLLLEDDGFNAFSCDLVLSVESIFNLRRHVEEFLKIHHVGEETMFRIMMLVEELYMLTLERNPGRRTVAACTIIVGREITFISRDTGTIFDITDADSPVSSFRSFVVSSMMEQYEERNYLLTTSYNRQIFRFPAV